MTNESAKSPFDLDQWLSDLRQRNSERIEKAKEWLGEKYLLHPARQVRKQKQTEEQ